MSEFLGGRLDSEGRWSRSGQFPGHWGEPPTPWDSPERRDWIADNIRRGGRATHEMPARQRLLWLLKRREDPSLPRAEARAAAANRMRRERLLELLRTRP